MVGPQHGAGVWEPVARDGVRYVGVRAGRLPSFAAAVPALLRAADGDLLYASKPRLGSAGIGLLQRRLGRRPLLLDIDDWEVGFFLRGGPWGTAGRALNWGNPRGLPWTWLMERAARAADAVTVASRFLHERFGGTLIPHVRDTDAWRPGLTDPREIRARLDAADRRVIMFLGTAREHKGVDDLAAAVAALGRADLLLALVGTDPDSAAGRRLRARWPALRLVPPVAFSEVPRFLEAADVVVVPQREGPDTRGQVPAKVFDAMALGRPIVSTRVSMIPEILEGCGLLVAPGDPLALAGAIARLADDRALAGDLGRPGPNPLRRALQLRQRASRPFSPRRPLARGRGPPVKIALVCRPFVFHGGVETATAGLVSELVRRGHRVDLLSTRGQGPVPGVAVRPLPVLPQPSLLRLISFGIAARAAARGRDYDIVQSHERMTGADLYRAGEGTHRGYLEAMGRPVKVSPYHRYVIYLERRMFLPRPYSAHRGDLGGGQGRDRALVRHATGAREPGLQRRRPRPLRSGHPRAPA